MQQANIVPVKNSQNHQLFENSGVLFDETFTAPRIEPIMKDNNSGSSSMYWFKVIKPTSEKFRETKTYKKRVQNVENIYQKALIKTKIEQQ